MKIPALPIAVFFLWFAGCGDDADEEMGAPPKFVGWSIHEGGEIASNAAITASFDRSIAKAEIEVTDAVGVTHVASMTATWIPAGDYRPGPHTATVVMAEDSAGRAAIGLKPLNFIAVRA